MVYPEKRGKGPFPVRVHYKIPDGKGGLKWTQASGFADDDAAVLYGLQQEAAWKGGTWTDPRKAATPMREWCAEWLDARRKSRRSGRTISNQESLVVNHIVPGFGHLAVGEVNWWLVETWAEQQTAIGARTVIDIVSVLRAVMSSAVDADLIDTNPLLGRRLTGLNLEDTEKVWIQSDLVPRILDRCPDEVTRLIVQVIAYMGLRPGEAFALDRRQFSVRRDLVGGKPWVRTVYSVHPKTGQLHQYYVRSNEAGKKGKTLFKLGPPKPPRGARDVDVVPFLARRLEAHWESRTDDYLLQRSSGEWWDRACFIDQVFKPAVDGRAGHKGTNRWPAKEPWQPIAPGLTPHGLRHSMNVWMDEDGVSTAARCALLGHKFKTPGSPSNADYMHDTLGMRMMAMRALEARWRRSVPGPRLSVVRSA